MSGPYQGRDLSNCGVGRLRVAINCGVLSVLKLLYGILHHSTNHRKCQLESTSLTTAATDQIRAAFLGTPIEVGSHLLTGPDPH